MGKAKPKSENVMVEVKAPKGAKAESKVLYALIATAVTAVRASVQSVQKMEPKVADALIVALRHGHKFGDVMPVDRLVKDIEAIPHPMTKALCLEMVAWVKANSPIYWDAKKAIHVRKPGEEGYKPYDLETAEATPFYKTKQAMAARKAGAKAHADNMKPYSFKDFFNRAVGMEKTLQSALVKDKDGNIRGIVPEDKAKIEAIVKAVKEAALKVAV